MPSEPSYEAVDFTEYFRVMLRRRWLVVGVAAAVGVLAFAYAALSPVTYTTGAELELPDPEDTNVQNPAVFSAYVRDQARVISSNAVAERAASILDYTGDLRDLTANLEVEVPEDSAVVTVRYRGTSAERAQARAQAFTEAYVATKREEAEQSRQSAVQTAQTRVETIEENIVDVQQRYDEQCSDDANSSNCIGLTNDLSDLGSDRSEAEAQVTQARESPVDAGRILSSAPVPRGPSSPGKLRTTVLGLLGGLVLGVAGAFVVDRLDPKLRDSGAISHTLATTTLGSIPTFTEPFRRPPMSLVALRAPDSAEADAFRRLRASVLIALERGDHHVVAVTSATAGEGKSTVAANLAATISQAGRSVAVVSADLRRPALATLFGLADDAPGLADVLERRATPDEALWLGSTWLGVMSSGKPTGNASDVLLSRRMGDTVRALRQRFELVIVDTPPVLAVADIHSLGHVLDGALLVVSLSDATSEEVSEAEAELERLEIGLVGSITNRAANRNEDYYGYRGGADSDGQQSAAHRIRPGSRS